MLQMQSNNCGFSEPQTRTTTLRRGVLGILRGGSGILRGSRAGGFSYLCLSVSVFGLC